MTTADKVLLALGAYGLKKDGANQYRCNSPFRAGSDSESFRLTVHDDGEHGGWIDSVSGETGSLYELAKHLGVELPEVKPATDTKRAYTGLADYAQAHGVTEDVFKAAGWHEGAKNDRPCLIYPTANGNRYRFTDDGKPPYTNDVGYKSCWYGLDKAITKAKSGNTALILCNGEASTVVAQHYGLAACALTNGEKAIPDNLLSEFKTKWTGTVWIAMDCDDTGRRVAQQVKAQIPGSIVIDMQLSKGGDLADFCKLYSSSAYSELQRRIAQDTPAITTPEYLEKPVNSDEVARQAMFDIQLDNAPEGRIVMNPIVSLRPFGGMALAFKPGKMTALVLASGTGKTSILESLIGDPLAKRGERIKWYGSEFTPKEYHHRRIARYSGLAPNTPHINIDRLILHDIYRQDLKAGIAPEQCNGVPLSDAAINEYMRVSAEIARWQGVIQYLPPENNVDKLLLSVADELQKDRQAGINCGLIVIDYLQLLRAGNGAKPGDNIYEHICDEFKAFAMKNAVHIIISTQITKEGTAKTKRNQMFGVDQMLYVREDKFNLILGGQQILAETGDYDETGSQIMEGTDHYKLWVMKNSEGKEDDYIQITRIPHRLTFVDKRWQSQLLDSAAGD